MEKWDVIIVGTGLAGLYTAINLDKALRVLVLTKKSADLSNSSLAQGGIAAVLSMEDHTELHYSDTMAAGRNTNDESRVRHLVEKGPVEVEKLMTYGVAFDRQADGQLALAKEGAHTVSRIARCGDYTGRAIVTTLLHAVKLQQNITIREHVHVRDIIRKSNQILGVTAHHNGETVDYLGNYVVLATGGIGQYYEFTTNAETITGDGFRMAESVGLTLEEMSSVQFHPTALYEPECTGRRFLITEALRGEGAELKDINGRFIMKDKHELGSLAPRDIVTQAIHEVMAHTQSTHVYLDATHLNKEYLTHRFPTIVDYCKTIDLDPTRDYIPVVPCAHYLMGGIPVDLNGETQFPRLYACGEVAYTMVHGKNRLASNSLLECLVYASGVADAINGKEFRNENRSCGR